MPTTKTATNTTKFHANPDARGDAATELDDAQVEHALGKDLIAQIHDMDALGSQLLARKEELLDPSLL